MYALKVEQGKERILVRHISSGFVPSFQAKPGVRLLVVPGYVFSLVKVARSELVPENEWEIIEKISNSKPSVISKDGIFISGPLTGLDQYIVRREQNKVKISVKLFNRQREYAYTKTDKRMAS